MKLALEVLQMSSGQTAPDGRPNHGEWNLPCPANWAAMARSVGEVWWLIIDVHPVPPTVVKWALVAETRHANVRSLQLAAQRRLHVHHSRQNGSDVTGGTAAAQAIRKNTGRMNSKMADVVDGFV